jgi:hypothetical protein
MHQIDDSALHKDIQLQGPGREAVMQNLIAERRVKARDLHPGDIVRQHDWLLHIRDVIVGQTAVAIAVTEFDFQLHYAVDAQLPLAS